MPHLGLFLSILFLSGYNCIDGHYWREYQWKIPSDAIVAGKDLRGNNVYIGQAYLKANGLIPCRIVPGETELTVPWGGIKKVKRDVKILCGNPQKFQWIRANYTTLHLDISGKQPVLGGHEDGGTEYIGRLFYKGETKVGKVAAFWFGYSYMLFDDAGVERRVETYEVLTYADSAGGSSGVDTRVDTSLDRVISDVFGSG